VKARSDDGTKEYVSRFPFAVGKRRTRIFSPALSWARRPCRLRLYYKHAFIDKKKAAEPKA